MKIINERALIRGVAAAWAEQYRGYAKHEPESRFAQIGRMLAALDPEKATAADVAAIVGNDTWTRVPDCYACGGHLFRFVVEIPKVQETGEWDAVRLCPRCVGIAATKAEDQSFADLIGAAESGTLGGGA